MDGPRSAGGEKYSSLIDLELKDASCLFLVLFLCVARAQARVCRVFSVSFLCVELKLCVTCYVR